MTEALVTEGSNGKVKTDNLVFEDLIADFTVEEGREPDIEEMAHIARAIRRWNALNAD